MSFKDSLVAGSDNSILFNTIKVKNPSKKTVRLAVAIEVPANWKSFSHDNYFEGNEVYYNLFPGQSKNIPLNLLKRPRTPASWDSVKILVRVRGVTDTHFYYYHLRAAPEPRFYAQHLTEDLKFETRPDVIPLRINLKNTGNMEDTYSLRWQNRDLELDDKVFVRLKPGEDSNIMYLLKMHPAEWGALYHTSIILVVTGSGSGSYTHTFEISKPRNNIKEAESAYPVIPLFVETGIINQKDEYYYYVGTRGNIHFGDRNDLSFFYRSRQFGSEVYGIQQNMYLIDYSYHNWKLSAGTIQPLQRFFISNGRGISITHRWNEKKEISAAAVFRDRNFYYTSDNFSIRAKYPVGKFSLTNILTANFDDSKALNGYALGNELQILQTSRWSLDILTNAGVEEKTRNVPGVEKLTAGIAGGYHLGYKSSTWNFISNTEFYSNMFPGINKGMRLQMHQLTRNFNNKFAGLFYTSNYLNATYFKDTLYNTDVLRFNTEKFGITSGIKKSGSMLTLNTGIMRYTGVSEFGLDNLYFADINATIKSGKDLFISVSSQNAFKNHIDKENNNVYLTSTLSSFKYKWAGFLATYTSRPVFESEGGEPVLKNYDETITGGPFVNYQLFRKSVTGLARYQVSKSVYDQTIRTSAGGSISYSSSKLGLNVQFFANIPLTAINTGGARLPVYEDKLMNLTVTKQISLPVLVNRKYYDIKVVLYHDRNNNGVRDKNEQALKNVQVGINDAHILYSDQNGVIRYKNIKKGNYLFNFSAVKEKGLIPSEGQQQSFLVDGNITANIAYKKGKKISGHINIIRDSFSKAKLANDNIRVTATDTAGKTFTTFTDGNGDFSFYLPASLFKISLNEVAFEGSEFKPEQFFYYIDLIKHEEEAVVFTIRQKQRQVRFLEKK